MNSKKATGLSSEPVLAGNENPVFGRDLSVPAFHKALVLLCLLGLLVRIAFFLEHARTPSFGVPTLDQKYYDTVARMLLAGEDLRELHGFRPLLYPMFLAGWYKLGGPWGVDLALFVQHLLGVGTGVIVALLGAQLFRHRLSGVVGGALYLLAPVPLYFEGELLIEPSYTFLICLSLLLHWSAVRRSGWKAGVFWFLCGALTVLAAQARANILVFLAVYPLFALWRLWHSRKAEALLPLLGLPGALVMAIPWGVLNMKQSDHFHLIPNAGGVAFYLGNKHGADGMFVGEDMIALLSKLSRENRNVTGEATSQTSRGLASNERYQDLVEVWAREEYELAMRKQGREPDTDPMAISRYWTHRGLDEIRASPGAWLGLMARKCWLTLWNAEIPNNKDFAFLQGEFLWLRLLPVRWVVLLMLAPAGIWIAAKAGKRDALFILLIYVGLYSAGNVAFFICDRYRYPVWPAMAVLAGGGLLVGLELIRRRKKREVACLLGGMILAAALSLPNWFGAKLPNFSQDYHFRSVAWYEKGRFNEALSDIHRSIELDPQNAAAYHHCGNVLFALNRLQEAEQTYRKTLELIPGDSGAWNNLGATLEALGRNEDALQAFRRATECTPPSGNAFFGIAIMYIRTGRLDEAVATLDQLEKRERTHGATLLALRSVVELRRGNLLQADRLEQQARTLNSGEAAWAIERATKPSGGG